MDPKFFSVDDVLRFHELCIERDGGLAGVRDLGLLTSAVMMPRQMFAGTFLHDDIPAMAAAYLYHLSRNHPFLDGNKRVALAVTVAFLYNNGVTEVPSESDLCDITLAVAAGQRSKDDLIAWLRARLSQP